MVTAWADANMRVILDLELGNPRDDRQSDETGDVGAGSPAFDHVENVDDRQSEKEADRERDRQIHGQARTLYGRVGARGLNDDDVANRRRAGNQRVAILLFERVVDVCVALGLFLYGGKLHGLLRKRLDVGVIGTPLGSQRSHLRLIALNASPIGRRLLLQRLIKRIRRHRRFAYDGRRLSRDLRDERRALLLERDDGRMRRRKLLLRRRELRLDVGEFRP